VDAASGWQDYGDHLGDIADRHHYPEPAFPLAAGTIGGLIMSILGIFFYLPIFTLKKERH
jgi:putative lipase involved disintegration of autophagic bodies